MLTDDPPRLIDSQLLCRDGLAARPPLQYYQLMSQRRVFCLKSALSTWTVTRTGSGKSSEIIAAEVRRFGHVIKMEFSVHTGGDHDHKRMLRLRKSHFA
jgi:hypothetical protein